MILLIEWLQNLGSTIIASLVPRRVLATRNALPCPCALYIVHQSGCRFQIHHINWNGEVIDKTAVS